MVNFKNGQTPLSDENLNKMQQDANVYADKDHKVNDTTKLFKESNLKGITPLTGTNVASWGNSYYYKVNSKVHLHLAINLNTNARSKVYNLPSGFKPRGAICIVGGGASGEVPDLGLAEIFASGEVFAKSASKFICADIEYDAFN